jgi:predicted alpha/beta-fold hydrolase
VEDIDVRGIADFRPSRLVRNPHVQSLLASARWRVRGKLASLAKSAEIVVDTSSGSRLLALYLPHPEPRGLVLLLHGWEGSASSTYMIEAADFYARLGYGVCRLNLRDHGGSHHLNEGLFHGALLEETFEAVDFLAGLAQDRPAYLIGFSLGGNYALRIARRYSDLGQDRLRGVFAVSPPLDPYKTTLAIDNGPSAYRDYFLKKWKRSLEEKQRLFPGRYDFRGMLDAGTCMELTERIMRYFPDFPTWRDYFNRYTLKDGFFSGLKIPVTIFISRDDPVIPPEDYNAVSSHENLRILRTEYGGHCGFIDLFPLRSWYNEVIAAGIDRTPDGG